MSGSEVITLKGGLTLPTAAIRLALALEERGLRLEANGETLRVVGPSMLTDADRAAIRRWKPHLLAIVRYDADRAGGIE